MTTPIKIICLLVVTISYAAVVPVDNKIENVTPVKDTSTPASTESAKFAPVEVTSDSTTTVLALSESTLSTTGSSDSTITATEKSLTETTTLDMSKATAEFITAASTTKTDVKQNKETKVMNKDASKASSETEFLTTEEKLGPHQEWQLPKFNPWYDEKFEEDDDEEFNYPYIHGFDGDLKIEYPE